MGRYVDGFLVRRGGFTVRRDEHDTGGDIIDAMTKTVLESETVVVVVASRYRSAHGQMELKFAPANKKHIGPVLSEAGYDYRWSWIGLVLQGASCCEVEPLESKFEPAMGRLVETDPRQ